MKRKLSNRIRLVCTVLMMLAGFCACQTNPEKPVRFAIASDFHAPDIPDGEQRVAAFIQAANDENVDFIIELGDFCRLDSASQVYRDLWNSFPGGKHHVIGNHDMDRLAKNLDTDELKVAFAFLLSMPGAPFIYYGDEIGMRYVEGLTSVEGGYGRTGSRTPMQWDDSLSAGFSAARKDKYYIALDESADRPNAKTQSEQEDSLRSEVKRLIAFRKANPALQSKGEISFVSDDYPLVYKRTSAEQEITVIINPGADAVTVPNVNGKVLYTVGGSAVVEKGIVKVDGCTAVFVG